MTEGKRSLATGIIGLGIFAGEGHNWECINASYAISEFVPLIPPKSTVYAAVVKESVKWVFRGGYEHHIDPF
jgi:hypothetical protein